MESKNFKLIKCRAVLLQSEPSGWDVPAQLAGCSRVWLHDSDPTSFKLPLAAVWEKLCILPYTLIPFHVPWLFGTPRTG